MAGMSWIHWLVVIAITVGLIALCLKLAPGKPPKKWLWAALIFVGINWGSMIIFRLATGEHTFNYRSVENSADADANEFDHSKRGLSEDVLNAAVKGAMNGDYQSQRNAAYMLSQGSLDQRVSGCAWRLIIISSGHKEADSSDELNLKQDCGQLPESSRQDIQLRVLRISQQINYQ